MNRTIGDIQKDIELLGIKGGYDIEQLLTPQDCRRLSYEIERLNNIIKEQGLEDKPNYYVKGLEGSLKEYQEEIERLNNIINKIEEHFVFLKMNSTGGNKEFFEDILDFIKALRELKGSDKQ